MALSDSRNEVTVRRLSSVISGLWTKITTGFSGKADKVANATNGNFAALDANGNLKDSGKKAADFATSTQGGKADTAIQGVKVNGSALTPDANKVVNVSVPTAYTSNPAMNGTASAGSSSNWSRGDHVHPTDTSREAAANKETTLSTTSDTKFPTSKAVATFVNSSIATSTATFRGNFSLSDLGLSAGATDAQIATALGSHTWPTGVTPTNNDYVYVEIPNTSATGADDEIRRFKYDGSAWSYEYTLNNSSFTAAELAALDSGIDATKVGNYDSHLSNTTVHITATERSTWNGKQNAISDLATIRSGAAAGATALQPTGNASNTTVTFTAASSRTNIATGDKLSVMFGKIAKWLGDLKALAFKDKVANGDISGTISDSHIASASTWNSKAAGNHTHSVTVNGVAKTIPATGGTAVELMDEMTTTEVQDILDACT